MSIDRWYGNDPGWTYPLERDAKRLYGRKLSAIHDRDRVTYRHDGLQIPGRPDPVPAEIRFYRTPPYDTYGLAPEDYPRVFADPGNGSKHRMPTDDALCLYYAADALERRWTSPQGLLALLDLIADHLFFELHWRSTQDWLGPEAPHGFAACSR